MTYSNEPKSRPRRVQAPTAASTLIKLEREIRHTADRRRNGAGRAHTINWSAIIGFAKAIKSGVADIVLSFRMAGLAVAVSIRKLLYAAFRDGHRPVSRKPAAPIAPVVRKAPPLRTATVGRFMLSACLGLTGFCAIMILVLLLQMRDTTAKIAQLESELATTRAHLVQLERKSDIPPPALKEASATKTQPPHIPLSFARPDIKLIRESIRVLPPKPEATQKIHLGDEVAASMSAPVPDSLVEQLPKLRGARFSIDQNGAIVIVGPGSNQADAVISYH